jgi:hypothetical protein
LAPRREKWNEYLLALIWRYTRAVVCDSDGHSSVPVMVGRQSDMARRCIAQRLKSVSD